MGEEDDLKRALETWEAPTPRRSLDDRVLASYRSEVLAFFWWKRILRARITLPVPVGAALVLLVLFGFAWRDRGAGRPVYGLHSVKQAAETPCGVAPAPRPGLHSLVAGSQQEATYVTVGDFSGFRPVKDGNITIETKGGGR